MHNKLCTYLKSMINEIIAFRYIYKRINLNLLKTSTISIKIGFINVCMINIIHLVLLNKYYCVITKL